MKSNAEVKILRLRLRMTGPESRPLTHAIVLCHPEHSEGSTYEAMQMLRFFGCASE
jgi:hypothetical protein